MRGISAARGSIRCDNGDISLKNCQLSQFTLNNDYGDIDLERCTLDTAAVQLSNGGFDAQETAFSGENSITSSYGDVSVSDTLANLQALTHTGEHRIRRDFRSGRTAGANPADHGR